MKNTCYLFIPLVFTVWLSACSSEPQNGKEAIPFSYTDQNGQPFGTDELAGKVWIADFVFTKCTSVCPPMTIEMADLQKKFEDEGIQVEFVSFTVDPTIDSPEVLKSYLFQFTDDESNWHMLTGFSQEEIEVFAREQFQTIVQKPSTSNQVIHGTNFYLIDQQGRIVKEYNYVDESYVEKMIKDIKKLHK
ncbi:SCO family protein [Sporosarcina sp. ANT_H38]|uniref:SCO family protein n=1 Tax=Sporosarcina sp. ANT_H38 TaxID=2597358 RepID=UPI0011F102BB|nr:SCO family protein [Sporosarcina sp. ANT_H38]KAA0964994.1 SCO family protein [Sporosarcina sp. ANT_H38]